MKQITCEMCGGSDLLKQDGVFVCQHCGTKYSVEEAKKLMIEGTVDVSGSTVKIDNSAFIQKCLTNARRAYSKEDWEEVEKYYNRVEEYEPANIEATFFSAFGKAMLSLTDTEYHQRKQKFNVLNHSISVISDYFEVTSEDKEATLNRIYEAIVKMTSITYVYNPNAGSNVGGYKWQESIFSRTKSAFITELVQISQKHNDSYIRELLDKMRATEGGCYVATAVYGSYDCPQVWTLRRFRDYTLAKTWYGRAFVRTYYAISPTIVKYFGSTQWFKKMWKGKLDRMVANLNAEGIENTPYEDLKW